ncbi:MAG: MATE family efflux transporter, partial [Plesiomonas sp.]
MTSTAVPPQENDTSLATEPLLTLFWRYTLPTITAMVISGVYVTVDGIFVGHYLGEQGLAGVMLAYPVGSVLYAIGAMIGMGASSLVSLRLGQGKIEQARNIVGNALVLVIAAAIIIGTIGLTYGGTMLRWLGATGDIFTAGIEYLRWYFLLGFSAMLSMSFSALLRNDGEPKRVTYIMIFGGTLNVLLDYIFLAIIPLGLAGVGLATMLSQLISGGLCLAHFCSKRSQLRLSWRALLPRIALIAEILRLGTSSLLMYLYLSVVLALHNKAFMSVGNALNVAAYSVVSYAEAFFYLIFEG